MEAVTACIRMNVWKYITKNIKKITQVTFDDLLRQKDTWVKKHVKPLVVYIDISTRQHKQ